MFDESILAKKCLITKSVYSKERKFRWLYRNEPVNQSDSGWEVSCEFDDEEYFKIPGNFFPITISELLELEPMAEMVIEMPVGTEIIYDDEKDVLVNTATQEVIKDVYEPFAPRAFRENLNFLSEMSCDTKIVERLFDKEKFKIIEAEKVNFPTGKVVLSDPYYMLEEEKIMDVMEENIEPNSYKVLLSSQSIKELGERIFAAKIVISNEKVEEYKILKPEGREWQVVGVDTGLCGITDKATQEEYRDFYKKWKKENKGKNFYDEYLYKIFEQNNDIGIWKSEKTNNTILMCSTGFGDGVYNPICGYDKNGKLCDVVIMFITPDILDLE